MSTTEILKENIFLQTQVSWPKLETLDMIDAAKNLDLEYDVERTGTNTRVLTIYQNKEYKHRNYCKEVSRLLNLH